MSESPRTEPKSSAWKIGAGIGAAIVAAGAIYLAVKPDTPTVPTHAVTITSTPMCFKDQHGEEYRIGQLGPGRTSGIPGTHGVGIWGEDGFFHNLIDQCPTSGPEHRYKRPSALAGALALAWWDFYWGPNGYDNRCYVLPSGLLQAPWPPTGVGPCVATSRCRPFSAQAGTWSPRIYACDVPTTPQPTLPPQVTAPPGPCPTCPPAPCATPPIITTGPPRTPTKAPSVPPRPTRFVRADPPPRPVERIGREGDTCWQQSVPEEIGGEGMIEVTLQLWPCHDGAVGYEMDDALYGLTRDRTYLRDRAGLAFVEAD